MFHTNEETKKKNVKIKCQFIFKNKIHGILSCTYGGYRIQIDLLHFFCWYIWFWKLNKEVTRKEEILLFNPDLVGHVVLHQVN